MTFSIEKYIIIDKHLRCALPYTSVSSIGQLKLTMLTFAEPERMNIESIYPRLYNSEQAAKSAIKHYCNSLLEESDYEVKKVKVTYEIEE